MKGDESVMINKKRLAAAVVFLAAVAAAILTSAAVRNFFTGEEMTNIKFRTGIDYRVERCGNNVLLVNNEGIKAMNRAGKEEWSAVFPSTSPHTAIKGDYIMIADINGKNIGLYKNEKQVSKIKTDREILFAALNKSGYVAAASDEPGYKGMVTVYDKNGKEVYRWHSGTGYIGGMDISPRGMLAVLQVMTDKESVYTKVLEMDMHSKDEAKVLAEIDGIVFDAVYRDNSCLTLVGDSAAYNLKRDGKIKCKIDFEGRTPISYNIENENNLLFAFDSRLNNTVLESYSASGEKKGSYEAEGGITAFDVSGETTAAAGNGEIVTIDSSGKVKKTVKTEHDAKHIKLFSSRDKALVVGGSSVEIIKLK